MKGYIHPEIGEVVFKKVARSKSIRIKVAPNKSVVVTMPQYATYNDAEKMLLQNLEWVKTHQAKFQEIPATKPVEFNYETSFQVRHKTLKIIAIEGENAYLQHSPDKIEIKIPKTWNIIAPNVQKTLQNAFIMALKKEAKEYLINRTREIAKDKGIIINDIRVKDVKTKWGSCSSKNNINFTIYLMLLPDELIDYIIYHELAHVKEKNHQPGFWNHLESLLPGAKVLDKKMKNYRMPFFEGGGF